jgi:hypothetical protein
MLRVSVRALPRFQQRQPIRTAGIDGAGKVPEQLVLATVAACVRLARRGAAPEEAQSERIVAMVGESMKSLAQESRKPNTTLLLHKLLG